MCGLLRERAHVILLCLIMFSIQDETFNFMTWIISLLLPTNTLNKNFTKKLYVYFLRFLKYNSIFLFSNYLIPSFIRKLIHFHRFFFYI